MVEIGTGKPSIFAALLSLGIPGLGQLYLRKPGKMLLIWLGIAVGLVLVYANSYPVRSWQDMKPQLLAREKKEVQEHTVWQFQDGRQLRFRPHRLFQLSGWLQVVLFWLYGVVDGWQGRRGRRGRKSQTPETESLE